MSREVKRVPLDFDWPLKHVWRGYINPHGKPCPAADVTCFNGETAAAKWLGAVTRLLSLIGEQAAEAPHADELRARGIIYPHPYLEEWGQAPRHETPRDVIERLRANPDAASRIRELHRYHRENPPKLLPLTSELVDLVEGIGGRKLRGPMDSGLSYEIHLALTKAAKLNRKTWGICPVCKGEGIDPATREAYEAWTREEPPTGEGWQLWETVSEGSPITPVFQTRDKFIDGLALEWLGSDVGELRTDLHLGGAPPPPAHAALGCCAHAGALACGDDVAPAGRDVHLVARAGLVAGGDHPSAPSQSTHTNPQSGHSTRHERGQYSHRA